MEQWIFVYIPLRTVHIDNHWYPCSKHWNLSFIPKVILTHFWTIRCSRIIHSNSRKKSATYNLLNMMSKIVGLLCNLIERYFCFKGVFSLCHDWHVGMDLPTYQAPHIRTLLFIPLLESEIPQKGSFFLISMFCTCSMSVIQISRNKTDNVRIT